MMTPSTLEKQGAVLKNRGPNDFSKQRRRIVKNEVQFRLTRVIEREKDAPIIRDTTLGNLARREPARRREDGESLQNGGVGKFSHQIIRGRRVVLEVALDRDPIEEKLVVTCNRSPLTVRAKRGKEDIMMFGEGVEAVLAIESQDKILSGTS